MSKNNLCVKSLCTGCKSCQNACPKNAIFFQPSDEGFEYPYIDDEKCVECGLCSKSCPIESCFKSNNSTPEVYVSRSANKEILQNSSSGGVFSELSISVIKNGGVVYGATMDPNTWRVLHKRVSSIEELSYLRGSKYIQSDINDTYEACKTDLVNGLNVLYSGTPCQIAGLKQFLNREYNNLVTVDVVCHGVPSYKIFKSYVDKIKLTPQEVMIFNFRNTKIWDYDTFINKGTRRTILLGYKNFYMNAFLNCLIFRESCYNCQYSSIPRIGDITLGDFWGLKSSDNYPVSLCGNSAVLINNDKGKAIFNNLVILKEKRTLEEVIPRNPNVHMCSRKPELREKVISDLLNPVVGLKELSTMCKFNLNARGILGYLKRRLKEFIV